MKKIFCLLLGAACKGLVMGQPAIHFESTKISVGTINLQETPEFKKDIVFVNTGTEDLVIQRISGSSLGISGICSDEPIKPGGKGSFKLVIDAKNTKSLGRMTKSVTITSNAGMTRLFINYAITKAYEFAYKLDDGIPSCVMKYEESVPYDMAKGNSAIRIALQKKKENDCILLLSIKDIHYKQIEELLAFQSGPEKKAIELHFSNGEKIGVGTIVSKQETSDRTYQKKQMGCILYIVSSNPSEFVRLIQNYDISAIVYGTHKYEMHVPTAATIKAMYTQLNGK